MIGALHWPEIETIARSMREIDRREICGLQGTDDPVQAVSALKVVPHIGVAVFHKDRPVAAIGGMWLWPGSISVFMFATDEWPKVAMSATKFVKSDLLPAFVAGSAHRLQCHSLKEHTQAHDWLRFLGADRETPMPAFGKNREDYVLFEMSEAALKRVTSVGN